LHLLDLLLLQLKHLPLHILRSLPDRRDRGHALVLLRRETLRCKRPRVGAHRE
jgi:hypothetical protein